MTVLCDLQNAVEMNQGSQNHENMEYLMTLELGQRTHTHKVRLE